MEREREEFQNHDVFYAFLKMLNFHLLNAPSSLKVSLNKLIACHHKGLCNPLFIRERSPVTRIL